MATRTGASLVDAVIPASGGFVEIDTILMQNMISFSLGGYIETGATLPTTPLILVLTWNRFAGGGFNEGYNISNIQAINTRTPLNGIPFDALNIYSVKIGYTQPTGQTVTLKLSWGGIEP